MKITRKQLRQHLNYLLKETRIYGASDIQKLTDADHIVSLIKGGSTPFQNVRNALNITISRGFPDCDYYRVVTPDLSKRLVTSHGAGSTDAGDIGETIVSILSAHIGTNYPAFDNIIATENLNNRYSNLGIPAGFFPGMDIIGFKSQYRFNFQPTSGNLNFTNHAHLCSAKRGGSPNEAANVRRSSIIGRNANQDAMRNIAVVLGLRWLQENSSAAVEDPLDPDINNDTPRQDVLDRLIDRGITTITYTFSDLQINTIPYLDKNDLTDPSKENMTDEDLSATFPLLEAISVHPGGAVTFDVVDDSADYTGAPNIHGTSTTHHELAGILISGGIADLSGEGQGRTEDILHNVGVEIDLSELPFELNGNEVFGTYEKRWDNILLSTQSASRTRFKSALQEKLGDAIISNASSEFKTAVALLDQIDGQLFKGSPFIHQNLPLPGYPGTTLDTSGVDISAVDKTKLAMTQGQGSAAGIHDKYKVKRNKKKVFTDDLLQFYKPDQVAQLGSILRQFIVNNIKDDIADSQDIYDKLITRENLDPDDSILLKSIDDWLDSVRMFVTYLALFTIKCIKQTDPNDPVNDLLEIARDYKSIVAAEASNPVGLAAKDISIRTGTDSSGNLTFPGMRESFKRKKDFLLKEFKTPFKVAMDKVVSGITSLSTLIEAITSVMEEYNSEIEEDIIVNPVGIAAKQVIARPTMTMAGVREGKIREMIRESLARHLKRKK